MSVRALECAVGLSALVLTGMMLFGGDKKKVDKKNPMQQQIEKDLAGVNIKQQPQNDAFCKA